MSESKLDRFPIRIDPRFAADYDKVKIALELLDDDTLAQLEHLEIFILPTPTFTPPPPNLPTQRRGFCRTYPATKFTRKMSIISIGSNFGFNVPINVLYHEIAHALDMEEKEAREFGMEKWEEWRAIHE